MPSPSNSSLAHRLIGRPGDWQIRRPVLRAPRPSASWIGVILVIASVTVSWFAFDGARGEDGSVAFGLFIGAASILLMAWSFNLAIRLGWLEPLFGGLDRMYRVHRWAGTLAIVAMFLHTSTDAEIEGGVPGAAESLADQAEGWAGTAETALYVLIAISLLRWFPYRYWRWTHKLLGIPFAFACWHFFTAEKPYANDSAWGLWFGAFMIAGVVAYLIRVVGRDMAAPGHRYRISGVDRYAGSLGLTLTADDDPLQFTAGQFAVLKLQKPGLAEPHVFTIASSPEDEDLRFFIRRLGDWTARIREADLEGAEVIVEGPYGRFAPTGEGRPTVWVAGGVGITPFLSASASLPPVEPEQRPVLFYCVGDRSEAMAIEVLEEAADEGRLELRLIESRAGRRFGLPMLRERFGESGLNGAHVAVCGPAGLVAAAESAGRALGATEIEREDFDIRQGFGPEISEEVEGLLARARQLLRPATR